MVHELGELIAESVRFGAEPNLLVADVDAERIEQERMRTGTFNDAARAAGDPEQRFRRIAFEHRAGFADIGLARDIRRFPFVPNTPERRDADCYEAFNIQVVALAKRLAAAHAEKIVIGVSGGLDSTHALIVAAKAMDRLGKPRTDILAFTLPGFATGDATKANAWALMKALGVTADEIDIRPAARRMLEDIGHPFAEGEPVYDVTFENVQAGLRTDYLFRLANQRRGIVLGTGDLSELALGWCTYGVGDQMSHYAINAGVPKTLIQFLIRWCIRDHQYDQATDDVLTAILATEISPELVPADAGGAIQSTESIHRTLCAQRFLRALRHPPRHGAVEDRLPRLACVARRRRRGAGQRICPPRRGSPTTCRRSRPGWTSSSRASSRPASSNDPRCPTDPRFLRAARCRRAATGARRRMALRQHGSTNCAGTCRENLRSRARKVIMKP